MDNKAYFMKEVKCPVCARQVNTVVIKTSGTRMVKRDEDFCAYYEPINRVFYDVIICSECGYAAMIDRFEKISDKEIKIVKENIRSKWTKRQFETERTLENVLQIYKLALINLQVIKAKNSDLAKVCLRIAWLYRFANNDKEKVFLEYAKNAYLETYQKEAFPVDKLDEVTCMYMIGELSRRLGKKEDAARWLYNVISYKAKPGENQSAYKSIINMAREQLQIVKES